MPASTRSAYDWPSPTPLVSMGAGVLEQAAGVSTTGVSMTGDSATGATVAPMLGSLELVGRVSAFLCDSLQTH